MDANTMPQAVICEVCGSYFETRRGLSSHARLHLRQLGVTMSESSRGPIDLLYQIVRERDGGLPNRQTSSPVQPALATSEDSDRKDSRALTVPDDRGPSKESAAKAKPLWAPQESDAPLTLASSSSDEFHVCQLCGAWYETRKGLSSHARFHLRRFGLSDSKTSPIEHLYKVMVTRHIKPVSKEQQKPLKVSPKTCAKRPSVESPTSTPLQPPPSKRAKAPDKFVCMLCGEEFDNRTGLSSHSRSHLRHMGVNDLLGKSSAIDAVEELVSSGVIAELWTHKTSPGTSSGPAQTLSQAPTSAQSSPLLSQSHSPTKANFNHSPLLPAHRAPKAKKGFRLAVDPQNKKPKQEPIEVEMHSPPLGHSSSSNSPTRRFSTSTIYSQSPDAGGPTRDSKGRKGSASPLDFSLKEKSSPSKSGSSQPADRCCELCGFEFENRKALASHSRAHLRQLGVTEWKADGSKGSPIEFLNAWIRKEPTKVAEITQRYRMGDLYIRKKPAPSPSVSTEANCVPGSSLNREGLGVAVGSSKAIKEPLKGERGLVACSDVTVHPPRGFHPSKHLVPTGEDSQDGSSQQQPRPKNIPALLPKPPLTPLVKLVGKYYSLKCRFCEEVFHGPVSIQVDWIAHLQKHILMLGYKGKASLCPTSVSTPTLIDPVAV